MKIVIFQMDESQRWFLNIIAPDGGLLFCGERGYKTKRNAATAGFRLIKGMQRAVVVL